MTNQNQHNLGGISRIVQWSFLALIFSLGFMQPSVNIKGLNVMVTEGLFLFTCFIWLVALLIRQARFRSDPAFYIFCAYALGLLISAIFSEAPRSSAMKFPGELYLIGLAVLTFNIVDNWVTARRVVLVWVAASAAASLIGTLTVTSFYLGATNFITGFALHHYGSLPPGFYPRIQGTFFYPSMLCNYLTVSLMMLCASLKLGWISRSVFYVLLVLIAITIAFTVTPGIGGVLLAVAMWYFLNASPDNTTRSKAVLAGGSAAAVLFLLVSTFSLLPSPTSPYTFDLSGLRIDPTQRLLTWQGASETFLQHPLAGKGLGLSVATVYFMPPSGQIQLLTDAHNVFLSVAGQAGLAGVVPLVLIAIIMVRRSWPLLRPGGQEKLLLGSLGIAFISAFVYQGLVGSFENARHLWVLMGLILAVNRLRDSDASPVSRGSI